jgi:hypothetical protein
MGTGRSQPSPPPPTSSRKRAASFGQSSPSISSSWFEPCPPKIGVSNSFGLAQGGEDSEEVTALQGTDDTGGDDGVGCVPADGGEAGRRRAAHRQPRAPLRHSHRQGDLFSFLNFLVQFDGHVFLCACIVIES